MSDNWWEHPSYLEKQEKRKRDIACASELLKRVATAIRYNHDTIAGHKDGPDGWVYYIDDARAAIAAVAEWLDNDSKVSLALSKQLEAKE